MSIEVNLVLPDNLRSSFLRGEFIEQGQTYTTLLQNNNPARDLNRHTLSFGFELVDTETREPVALTRIKSLKISNDPDFDAPSTLEITNWPSGTYSADTTYTYTFNPAYFFDPSHISPQGTADDPGSVTGNPGFFVQNWPLSSNGGLSTVYFKAVLEAGAEEITYPGSYSIFDQIFWETEKPSTPGKPEVLTFTDGWIGRKYACKFRASEESSTGRFNSGVSRYIGDIIEVRKNDISNGTYNLYSTLGSSLAGVSRSILPDEPSTTMTVTGYNAQYDNTGYATNVGRTINTNLLLNTSGVLRGAALYTVNQITLSPTAPDFCVQAHVQMSVADLNTASRYYIKAYHGTFNATSGSVDELVVRVNIPALKDILNTSTPQQPTADIYRLSASYTPTSVYSVNLPMHIVPALLAGGLLELFLSNFDSRGLMQISAYFTPDGAPAESVLIASTLMANKFADAAALGGAVVGAVTGGDGTFQCDELVIASGRFLIDVDLGDCFNDDHSENTWLAANTTSKNWNTLLANGNWLYYTEFVSNLADSSRSENISGPSKSVSSDALTLSAPGYLNQKSVAEIQCSTPTMSSRAQITFDANVSGSTNFGEYYVAFSPYAVTEQLSTLRPMVSRCDPYQKEADEPMLLPTVVVGFSPVRGIYVSQRNVNNSLTTKKIMHFTPDESDSETWQIVISNEPSSGSGDTTNLVILRNKEVVGTVFVGNLLPAKDMGLGFYVALGVRSEKATQSEASTTYNADCTFSNILIEGLQAIHSFGDDDPVSIRHFAKYDTGATTLKPLMGQYLIDGSTDAGDFKYTLHPQRTIINDLDTEYIVEVAAVTIGANIQKTFDCPSYQLDLVETSLGGYVLNYGDLVLVKDQINPIENGVYQVKYDIVSARYYWERWADLNESTTITASSTHRLYIQMRDRWAWCQNCRVATTAVVADFNNMPTTIDGVVVKIGDRVLVCQESSNFIAQGIYSVASINSGGVTCVLSRASDMNVDSQLTPRARVKVELGNTWAGTYWGFKLVAELPPSAPYVFGTTNIHIHKQSFNLSLEPCRYASNINLVLSGLIVGSYTLNDGDRLLIKAQTNAVENGIYIAHAGAWTRAADFDAPSDVFPQMMIPVKDGVINKITRWTIDPTIHNSLLVGTINMRFVKVPNLEGLTWFLDTDNETIVGTTPMKFTSSNYAQSFDVWQMGLNTSFTSELLDLKIRNDGADFTSHVFPSVRLHLHDISTGKIGAPLTDWIPSGRRLYESFLDHGGLVSQNDLVQFDMTSQPLYLDSGRKYWLIVRTAAATSLRSANASELNFNKMVDTNEFTGLNLINDLYFKLFARSVERYDSTTHATAIHSRVRSDSHARIESSASVLSNVVRVDLHAPTSSSVSGRPFVSPTIIPAVRSAVLSIDATDGDSGMLAFRVGREGHYGMVDYTCWQPWSAFNNAGTIEYTTYLYNTWWNDSLGLNNPLIFDSTGTGHAIAGSTSDGSRKVWVQVMDGVGNISESYPLTLIAQGLALVDTVAPMGDLNFSNNLTGIVTNITNASSTLLSTSGADRTSAVKDIRFRALKAGVARTWSAWHSYEEYVQWAIDNDIQTTTDGLKRVEAQFRDYGNNIEYEAALWDSIYDSVDKNVLFIAMATWKPFGETNETLYLSGIKSENYTGLNLSDSFSKDYPDNTAYYATSTETGSVGRQIRVRGTDHVTAYINASPTTNFVIDGTRGLIVFNNPTIPGDVLTADVHRDYAVIYKWDGDAVLKVVDMGYYEESAIISMCSTHMFATTSNDNFMLLGGASGRVWKFNGSNVSGPVFVGTENDYALPITTLTVHQFPHESNPYIYAGTANFPRLYRASLPISDTSTAWSAVANIGFLQSGIGDITCACSAYGMLFLGTNNGRVIRYERTLIDTTDSKEQETLNESMLQNEYIGEYESNILPVSCLLATQDQILAGIGDRPEIWNFVLTHQNQPKPSELWSKQLFNKWFIHDSVPWQYYSTVEKGSLLNASGRTHLRGDSSVVAESISDPDTENGYRDLILLSGGAAGTQTEFIANVGTDWEQLISNNAPSNTLQNVVAATVAKLPFEPIYNNGTLGVGATLTATIYGALVIDGVTITINKRILVKDQANSAYNGVYSLTQVGTNSVYYILTRVVDLDGADNFISNLSVTSTGGDLNINNSWLLYPQTSYVVGATAVIWLKPTWAMEFDMMYFTGAQQGFRVSDGYYVTDVSLSSSELTLSSGGKTKTVPFRDTNIQTMSIGGAKYPSSNVKKIWNFFNTDSIQDRGPYWTGEESSASASVEDWNTYRFVIPSNATMGIGAEEPETNASFTTKTQFVRITPTATSGAPRFGITNLNSSISVNTRTKVYTRLRITNNSTSDNVEPTIESFDLSKVKIRFAWSESGSVGENTSWYELPAKNTNGFELYVFEPSWNQTLRSLSVEVSGLNEGVGASRPYVDVDYVALVSDELAPNFADNFTQVRVAVEGRDVKVWLGKSEQPLLNEINFLTLPTTQMEIRFGKIDILQAASTWGWGYLQFVVGGSAAERLNRTPTKRIIYDFALQQRLPSAGGVRCLVNYQGSAWALTDGISEMKISDNPNDRAAKTFEYIAEQETWSMREPPCPKEISGKGLIHPLAATSYYGTLIVTGERGNIRFTT